MSEIGREEILPTSPEEVWEHFQDAERLSEWFGADVRGDVAPGETLDFTFPGSRRRALVEIAEPGRRLVFRWLPTETMPDGRERRRESSRVAIHLEPIGEDTLVRVTETLVGSAGTPRPRIGFRPHALAR